MKAHHKLIILLLALIPVISYADVLMYFSKADIPVQYFRFFFYNAVECLILSSGIMLGYMIKSIGELRKPWRKYGK